MMEPSRSSSNGSGSCGNYAQEITESFNFSEDIQSLMTENILLPTLDSSPETDNSFTALLGLPKNHALELLHKTDSGASPAVPSGEIWKTQKPVPFSFSGTPSFPSNSALVERAARFSVFAEESPQTSSDPSNSTGNSLKPKVEPVYSDSNHKSSATFSGPPPQNRRSGKRKEGGKVKAAAKKSKGNEDGTSKKKTEESEKLPYVHVRARRGQATDSHSLAERARRDKINARMKLLQELVPGCSKISGTALVLDEIINHVQYLQHQVESLSMRLAAVNPRIDFGNLDSCFFSPESGSLATDAGAVSAEPLTWPDFQFNLLTWQQHGQQVDAVAQTLWEGVNNPIFVSPESGYHSQCSASLHSNSLKMEL